MRGPAGAVLAAACALFVTGCATTKAPHFEPMVARFFLETRSGEPGKRVSLPLSQVEIEIAPKPVVMEFDITDAEVAQVALGRCLMVKLTLAAARDLYRITGAAVGRRLVITLNDEVLGARKLDTPLEEGAILIFLEKPDEQLPGIAERLKSTSAEVRRQVSGK